MYLNLQGFRLKTNPHKKKLKTGAKDDTDQIIFITAIGHVLTWFHKIKKRFGNAEGKMLRLQIIVIHQSMSICIEKVHKLSTLKIDFFFAFATMRP